MNKNVEYKIDKILEEFSNIPNIPGFIKNQDPLRETLRDAGLNNEPKLYELIGQKAALQSSIDPNISDSKLGVISGFDKTSPHSALNLINGPTKAKAFMTSDDGNILSDNPTTRNAFFQNPTEKTALDYGGTNLDNADHIQKQISDILGL